jgi:glycerophosphoryl diester phosphodiesterase
MQKHSYFTNSKVVVLAHRGGTVPTENTIEAFKIAIAQGADIIETDVQATKDGKAVLFHDETLERLVDWQFGNQYEELFLNMPKEPLWKVAARGTLPEPEPKVKDIDWTTLKNVKLRGGTSITTLEQALEAFPKVKFNIDIKAKDAIPDLVATIEKLKAHDRVLVSSFSNRRRLLALSKFSRPVATSASASTVLKIWLFVKLRMPQSVISNSLKNIGALQIPRKLSFVKLDSKRFIHSVLASGTQIHYWTINSPEEMLELTRLGATGIVTDVPELAVRTLRKA